MKKLSGDERSVAQAAGYMPDACPQCSEYLLLPDNRGSRICQGCQHQEPWDDDDRDSRTKALQSRLSIRVVGLPHDYSGMKDFQSMAEYMRMYPSSPER